MLRNAVVATVIGDTFAGTLVRYRSWGKFIVLKDASLKDKAVDGLVLIPKSNVSFLQVVPK